ncbi:MAG: hypothetical protein PHR94_10695 [Methylomonas lenta]|nr:hypothetical protein [Methylomonas lenta]
MRIFVPEKFVPKTMNYDFTQQQGREIVQNVLAIVNQQLPTTLSVNAHSTGIWRILMKEGYKVNANV